MDSSAIRFGKCGPVPQRPGEIFAQACAEFASEGARLLQAAVEVVRADRHPEGFQLRGPARRVLTHQHEIARVRHQHQPLPAPVAAHRVARCREPSGVSEGLHLDHSMLRQLALARLALLHLFRRVEAEVGMTRTLIGKLTDTEDPRLERGADGIEQVRKRPVARPFPGCTTRCAHPSEISEIRLDRRRQLRVRSCHRPSCRRARRAVQAPALVNWTVSRIVVAGDRIDAHYVAIAESRRTGLSESPRAQLVPVSSPLRLCGAIRCM